MSRKALYDAAEKAASGKRAEDAAPGTFFLTLAPVASPVSLPRSTAPALQRFRFFFTREQDPDGDRERHWLNFGYFQTVEEARKWREVLCRIYPGAVVRVIAVRGGVRHW
jgi:hypothetical protein